MSKFYVYYHVEPDTREIVYVGKGTGGRAWDVTRARGDHKNHQNWMLGLMEKGYVPSDWVVVYSKGLLEEEAFTDEKELLHEIGVTRFNRQTGDRQHQAKMSNEQALEAFKLKEQGWLHKEIAELYGVSRSAISMLLSGKQWKAVTAGVRSAHN